jgi:L-fucose isomerase-like protein
MTKISVKLGFVPSIRFGYSEWVQKMRDDSIASISSIPGLELVVPQAAPEGFPVDSSHGYTPHGMVQNIDQGEAIAAYFSRQEVDGLVLCPLDFGDERSAAKIAEKMKVPVLLFATKEPPAKTDASLTRVSDSYCGNLSMASGLYRRKIPFHYAGLFFPDDEELKIAVENFARAVAVVKNLMGARIGQIGVRPATFETVSFDEGAMMKKFHQNVIVRDLSEIVYEAKKIKDDDPRVLSIIQENRMIIPIISVGEDFLVKEAKMELALTQFWQEANLSAMAMSCWPAIQAMYGFSTCGLFGRLTGKGMLTACETDVLGSLAMLVNYSAALGETPPHFVDWTIQHRENNNRLLAWHCGNAPVALASNPSAVALRSRHDMKGENPVPLEDRQAGLLQFQLKPGRVTFCRLAEYDDAWKMLITSGEIIPSEDNLAGTWSWVEVPDHEKLYRTLVEEGFIHHASMIHGDQVEALKLVCKFLNIQPVVV